MCYPLIKLRLSIDHGYVLHLRRFRRLPDIIEITYCMGSSVRWPGAMALVGYFAFPLFLSSLSFSFFFIHFLYIYFPISALLWTRLWAIVFEGNEEERGVAVSKRCARRDLLRSSRSDRV